MLKKVMIMSLVTLCLGLQYKLWLAPGGWTTVQRLQDHVAVISERNQYIEQINVAMIAEIDNLKHGYDMAEHQARLELGMIREDETYYRYI